MKFKQVTPEIFVIADLMPEEICQAYILKSERLGYEPAALNFGKTRVVREHVRNNLSVNHKDPSLAAAIWKLCGRILPQQTAFGRAIGLNDDFRFYKYEPGMRFRAHRDGIVSKSVNCHSYYTFMIYLNDDFEGGNTNFKKFRMKPRAGYALVFAHNLLHEGAAVTSGTKYVLRSEILYEIGDI